MAAETYVNLISDYHKKMAGRELTESEKETVGKMHACGVNALTVLNAIDEALSVSGMLRTDGCWREAVQICRKKWKEEQKRKAAL